MLMQQVLGADWHKLPPAIQQHYALSDKQSNYLQGSMTIDYPNFIYPLIWLIHLFGGLVLWRGTAETQVRKIAENNDLNWQRFMCYADNKSDYFGSRMVYVAEHELCEHIGFGFALNLVLEIDNGDLLYRSNGHYWQCGKINFRIPDWLLLGTASIREHAISETAFYLDFRIQHPVWGETYCYQGLFENLDI